MAQAPLEAGRYVSSLPAGGPPRATDALEAVVAM